MANSQWLKAGKYGREEGPQRVETLYTLQT